MGNVYLTGDQHGNFSLIFNSMLSQDDVLVVLGDAGVNYYQDERDAQLKKRLQETEITFLFVRGNHEARPEGETFQKVFKKEKFFEGQFMEESQFPNLLYMLDGEEYRFTPQDGDAKTALVIGGAFSVDKDYRLQRQAQGFRDYKWFPDEQLSETEMQSISEKVSGHTYDYVFTHTCPACMIPRDMFLPFIDQSNVDDSMERFLQRIHDSIQYSKWYCGHWHTDRIIDTFRFLFHDIIPLGGYYT